MSYKIGIIGGGQLAYMLAIECKKRGIQTACLDQDENAPALKICDFPFVASFSDVDALEKLCQISDAVTYEFENIDCDVVAKLSKKYNIPQGERPLWFSKNRLREKSFALLNGLTPPKFFHVKDIKDVLLAVAEIGFPFVLKTLEMGYDGKGQFVVKNEEDLTKIPKELLKNSILEQFIKYDFECSVIAVRNLSGEIATLPIGQNIHKNGILDLCLLPCPMMNEKLEKELISKTKCFLEKANFYGILAIEYFVKGDKIYFNEMAPRPHNSGHYSIEGTTNSQYGLLVDFLTNEPFKKCELLCPTYMKNILGQDVENLKKLQADDNTYIHDYHKLEARLNRKMGHVTFTNITKEEFWEKINKVFGD